MGAVPESLPLTPTSTTTTTTADVAAGTTWDRAELQQVVDDTIAVERMSFELELVLVLDGAELPFTRSGWLDDGSFQAEGAMELATGGAFEYRMTEGEYWYFDGVNGWIGANLSDVFHSIDENAVQSMDGDRSLFKIADAITVIEGVQAQPDGSTIVRTDLAADDLLYTIMESGFADRLMEVGGADTGAAAAATFTIENGLVVAIDADFSDWWSEVSSRLLGDGGVNVPEGPGAAELRITYTPYVESRTSERPCAEPTIVRAESPTVFGC